MQRPDPARPDPARPADSATPRVPVTLIGGYLGSGKTTIVNHLLANAGGRRLAVLVNDVGAVNVDASLIADHDGTTIELTNGCVCCAIADDFGAALESIRTDDRPFDQVVVELSGVAEPRRIVPWANTAGFVLDAVVVAVDAERITRLAADRYIGDAVIAQLQAADLIALTKTDLVGDEVARRARASVGEYTSAPLVDVVDGAIDPAVVVGPGGGRPDDDGPHPENSGRLAGLHAYATVAAGGLTRAQLRSLVEGFDDSVVRVKGVVVISDEEPPVAVHRVGRRTTVTSRPDLAQRPIPSELVVVSVICRAER